MKKIYFVAAFALLLIGGSCTKKYTQEVVSTAAYATTAPVCMGVGHDGSQTIRVWGKGSSESAAITQALKNAVFIVIFDGIKAGGQCNSNPLVTEVNARERYSEYFDAFFADGGEWRNYVTELVGNKSSRLHSSGSSMQAYAVVAQVNREALKHRLQADGVLAPGRRP